MQLRHLCCAVALALSWPAHAESPGLEAALAQWEVRHASGDPAARTLDAIQPLLPAPNEMIDPLLASRVAVAGWAVDDRRLARVFDERAFRTAGKDNGALLVRVSEQRLEHLLLDGRFGELTNALADARARYREARVRGLAEAQLDWIEAEAARESGDVAAAEARLDRGDRIASAAGDAGWDTRVRLVVSRADLLSLQLHYREAEEQLLAAIVAASRALAPARRVGIDARLFARLGMAYADEGQATPARQAFATAEALFAKLGRAPSVDEAIAGLNATARKLATNAIDLDLLASQEGRSGADDFARATAPYQVTLGRAGIGTAFSFRTRPFSLAMIDAATIAAFTHGVDATRAILTSVVMASLSSGDRDPELRLRAIRAAAMLDMGNGPGLAKLRDALAVRRRSGFTDDPSTIAALTDLGALELMIGDTPGAVASLRDASAQLAGRQARAGQRSAGTGSGTFGGLGWVFHLARGGGPEPLDMAFPLYLEALWRLKASVPDAAPTDEEAFRTLQLAAQSDLSSTMSAIAARAASGDLAGLLRERSDLAMAIAADEQVLARQLAASANTDALVATLGARRRRLAALDQEVARRDPGFDRLAIDRPVALAEVQKALREDEAIVIIIGGRDLPQKVSGTFTAADASTADNPMVQAGLGVYIAAVSRTAFQWQRADMHTVSLAAHTRLLRCQLDRRSCGALSPAPNAFDTRGAHELYTSLLAPLSPVTKGKANLMVVATGSLSTLPLTVLTTRPTPVGWRDDDPRLLARAAWLVRDHAITVLPTVASLTALRAQPARAKGPRIAFAGFGDPDLSRAGAGERAGAPGLPLGALPWSKVELARLREATQAPASMVFTGPRATERAVKTNGLDQVGLLMFATHGVAAGDWPGNPEPGLVLTPPTVRDPLDDGFLSASEVSGLKLNADWVILSACRTAGSDGRPEGESLSGLAKAFFHAGARSLLAAYWNVRDDVAATLTSEAVLRQQGSNRIGRARALQLSTLQVLGDPDDPTRAHPSVWAPLVLIGADDTVD